MKYWSRIDLHTHTNHDIDCKNKSIENNYTHKDYYEFLKLQEVQLKSVTNHNCINVAEHVKHALIADLLEVNHLVGVEIDYKFNKVEFQAITVLSPNVDVILYAHILDEIRSEKCNEIYFDLDDFSRLHQSTEFIFIPHAIKAKGILEKGLRELDVNTVDWVVKSMLSGVSQPVLLENTKDYHIHSVIEKIKSVLSSDDIKLDTPSYVGSDYKFDDDEARKRKVFEKERYSINSLPTYRGLEIAIRNYKTRLSLDDQIIKRERYIEEIKIKGNDIFEGTSLKLSPGLNVIIGNSGSGKTLLLNQIYYQINGESLSAAQKRSAQKKKMNIYESKVKNNELLEIKFDTEIDRGKVKVLEIPNVYSEILKAHEDDTSVSTLFGIDNTSSVDAILGDYKTMVSRYYMLLNNNKTIRKNGEANLDNITTAIKFLEVNKIKQSSFLLKEIEYDNVVMDKVTSKLQRINDALDRESNIIKYFSSLKLLFDEESSRNDIEQLILQYKKVVNNLKNEKIKQSKQEVVLKFDKMLHEIINRSISLATNLLGDRERAIVFRQNTINTETTNLVENTKNIIRCELSISEESLSFPYTELKETLERNKNTYARMTLDDKQFNIRQVDLLDSPLINSVNIKGKLKSIGEYKVNFEDSNEIKKLISKLREAEVNLSEILTNASAFPTNVELYMNDIEQWKLVTDINKGDIAKKSIEYFFNDLIRRNQPDIVLIDQPENDVDKSFITSTLSAFISDQKKDKQIIVTSHDAIITINADANKIIEAESVEGSKFKYRSYDLETTNKLYYEGTERVSTVLDGGKYNIKKRYQIYGGEIKYEN